MTVLPYVCTYFCRKEGKVLAVRTRFDIPGMWRPKGMICTRCFSAYPEHGSVWKVKREGCLVCGARWDLANVYEYREGLFEAKGVPQ